MNDDINLIYKTYGLPEIKKEGLTEIEYNHRCKYLRLYIKLIERCKSMTPEELSGYCEIHHILPRTMKGSNDIENLVNMPIRYHIMAHIIIVESYPEIDGLWYALWWITSSGKNEHIQKFRSEGLSKISTRLLAKLREDAHLKIRISCKSIERNEKLSKSLTGREIPKEVREKISKSLKGIKRKSPSEETRLKISNSKKGTIILPETREKISKALKGRKLTEERKKKISIANSGEKNIMWGKHIPTKTKEKISRSLTNNDKTSKKVMGPDGTIYPSISEASRQTKISMSHISNMINGKKPSNGWSLIK